MVSGSAPPGTHIEIRNTGAGLSLGSVTTAADGTWQITVQISGTGIVTLLAVLREADSSGFASDLVTITVALPVQPNTGIILTGDPKDSGRTFTALVALLLVVGGFGAIVAGRLIYLVAKHRAR